MFEILATDAAESDLTAIRDYLLFDLCNLQAWENLLLRIRQAYLTLQSQPYAFVACSDSRLCHKGYRKCNLGAYLFVYRVDVATSIIHIIRFFHGLQDYESQI